MFVFYNICRRLQNCECILNKQLTFIRIAKKDKISAYVAFAGENGYSPTTLVG